MIINMQTIPEGHSILTGTTGLEPVKDDLPSLLDKISYTARIDRTGHAAYVHVVFTGAVQLECSRCLDCFSSGIDGDFRLIIKERAGDSSVHSDSDEVDFYYDRRHELVDISPAFFDEIMLSIPLKPLCMESCKGIEINGLQNISVHQNGVFREQKTIDPRWEALKKIKILSNK